MRADEELCRKRFDAFLRKADSAANISWSVGEDPPDYYLLLDSEKFVVEVTSLIELIPIGKIKLPAHVITDELWGIVHEVEEIAADEGTLDGTYRVGFIGPIEDLASVRNQLSEALLRYIRSTQSLSEVAEEVVFGRGRQSVRIKKVDNAKNVVHTSGPTQGKWEIDVAAQICNLLSERINTKARNRFLMQTSLPKILLLYDGYRFANARMYQDCLPAIDAVSDFHSVFVVQDEQDLLLYSKNVNWRPIA